MNRPPPRMPPRVAPLLPQEAPRLTRLVAADWTIVLAHGGQWVGKLCPPGYGWLDPGLALDVVIGPGRLPGSTTIAYRCRPALFLVSWHRIRVPPDAHVQPCSALDSDDWHQIATALDMFEENMAKTLAARSGIALPQ